MLKPRRSHLRIVLRLLRYFKNSLRKGVCYLKTYSIVLKGFYDAKWDTCLFSRNIVSGYLVYFSDSLVSRRSENPISRSSTECEYRVLGSLTCEII